MYKRPSPQESEDDLLRMQDEYLKEKQKGSSDFAPAAHIVKLSKENSGGGINSGERKQSKFAQKRGLNPVQYDDYAKILGGIVEKNNDQSSPVHDTPMLEECQSVQQADNCLGEIYSLDGLPPCPLLGNIVERNWDNNSFVKMNIAPVKGFPEVVKRDTHIESGFDSVFATEIKSRNKNLKCKINQTNNENSKSCSQNLPNKSYVINCKESDIIHQENLATLSKMSEQEILSERESLLKSLDPNIVKFITSLRTKPPTSKSNARPELSKSVHFADAQTNFFEEEDDDKNLWENDVLSHPKLEKWLHFNTFEEQKLEWTKSMLQAKNVASDEPYEARFDFKGLLLPYSVEIDEKTKPLFHHANEPHRPGYSLSELFELTRSTVLQQRVMALNTIAGILSYFNAGLYNEVCDLPLSKILFVARFALDENASATIEPALKCIRNLIVNRIDEATLDALVGFTVNNFEPYLENSKREISELETTESELNDFYIADIDIITGLQRTNILQRIYYILDTMQNSFNSVQFALQIVTRFCRDSKKMEVEIAQSNLMQLIMKKYLPLVSLNFRFSPDIVYNGKPVLSALKLLRIMTSKKDVAEIIVLKYDIGSTLAYYINSGVDGTYGVKIQIEALYTLSNLLRSNLHVDVALSLFPVIATLLYKHIEGTDLFVSTSLINCSHASAVLNLVTQMKKHEALSYLEHQLTALLSKAVEKWTKQLIISDDYSCGHLKLLTAIYNCFIYCSFSVELMNLVKRLILELASSKIAEKLFQSLHKNSNLLSGLTSKNIFKVKNLINFGGTILSSTSRVVPILNVNSPMPFILSVMQLIKNLNSSEINEAYFKHMWTYLKELSTKQVYMASNWFSGIEIHLVNTVTEILTHQSLTSEEIKELSYFLCNKLCYILWSDKQIQLQHLFGNVLFNKEFFTTDWKLNMMSLSNDNFMKHLPKIRDMYFETIQFQGYEFIDTIWKLVDPLLPVDWIYLPIVTLYVQNLDLEESRQKSTDTNFVKVTATLVKEQTVTCCLEWILFNEKNDLEVCSVMNITDRFCRILCVYLCDNSIFLGEHVKNLLSNCLKIIYQKEKNQSFDFDRDLSGIPNFQDFYTQLIEQFQAVSYGDPIFAACLLIPQAQKHNVKWRKLLWSEYAGALRSLDCPEDALCYKIDEFLYPIETDRSVIISYHKALNSNLLRVGTIPYRIAKHHFDAYTNKGA